MSINFLRMVAEHWLVGWSLLDYRTISLKIYLLIFKNNYNITKTEFRKGFSRQKIVEFEMNFWYLDTMLTSYK